MRLKWDKNRLLECKENIKRIKKSDIFEDIFTKELIAMYDALLGNIKRKDQDEDRIYGIKDLKRITKDYDEYMADYFNPVFAKAYTYLLEYYGKMCLDSKEYRIKQTTSDEELLRACYETYLSIDKSFQEQLDFLSTKKQIHVDRNNEIGLDSRCLCDPYNNTGFVYINTRDTFHTKESIFNHEVAHALVNMSENSFYNENETYFELHSIFIYLYTNEYMYRKTKNPLYIQGNLNYLNYLMSLINKLNVIDIISNQKIVTEESVIQNIGEKLGLKITDMNYFISALYETDVDTYFTYLLSGVLALQMLSFDEEKGKYLFKKTMYNNYKDEEELLKDLEFDCNDEFSMINLFQDTVGYHNYLRKRSY